MNLKKYSYTKISIIVISGALIISLIGLGLAINTSTITTKVPIKLTDVEAQALKITQRRETYKNMNFLNGLDDLRDLLKSKATFLLYTGTKACAWCRVSVDLDEAVLADIGTKFEVPDDPNAFFRGASDAFSGTANGPLNDETINNEYMIYSLDDLNSQSVTEYANSDIPVNITNILLGSLDSENDLKFIQIIPFKNNSEVNVPSGISTYASKFKEFYEAYATADEFKIRANTEDLIRLEDNLKSTRIYSTPTFWAIIKGQPRFITTGYLTRKALEGFAKFFLNNNKTLDQLNSELIS